MTAEAAKTLRRRPAWNPLGLAGGSLSCSLVFQFIEDGATFRLACLEGGLTLSSSGVVGAQTVIRGPLETIVAWLQRDISMTVLVATEGVHLLGDFAALVVMEGLLGPAPL